MVCKLLFPRRTRREPLCLKFVTSLSLSPWLHLSLPRPRRAARGGGQPEPLAGGGGEPQGLLLYMRWSIGVYVLGPECVLDEQAPLGFTSFQNPSVRQVFYSFE